MVELFSETMSQGTLMSFGLAFLGGILASLTPCVYPVIPITISFFAGRASSHVEAIGLSVRYVLGMAVVYAALGLFAAMTGKVFGRITIHAPVYFTVGSLMIGFGLLQLKEFSFKVPAFISNLSSGKQSAWVMGMTSGVIVAPCTVPILGVILTYIATRQNPALGAALMFTFSCGLGLLLMAVGIFTNLITRLPRSGRWLIFVQKGAGALFMGVGGYFWYRAITLL